MMYWNQTSWIWMAVMPLVWIVVIGLVVWLVARFAVNTDTRREGPQRTSASRETPEEILDRRFASGEIDLDTYTEARDRLSSYRERP
ncbi:SHOCT domain-containing protein [Nocardiopsis sp. YSL2]|uniref:SHOCT domain-containing protein n=1 Tax=Nocardiopsis sp. YSL2 TaxID=2939492 RepID=UPI0026F43F73|nr:hypothetical protein [Nocardiopsis sp. YSL2]